MTAIAAAGAAPSDERGRRRQIERHAAAALRAVGSQPLAEFRGHRLEVAGTRVTMATPYLSFDTNAGLGRTRGVADALGLLLRHSDAALHRRLSPAQPFERLIFDILEQLRCESLADRRLVGLTANLDEAFDGWCQRARVEGLTESGLGILVYTLTHMARSRLVRGLENEDVEALIEPTWINVAPIVGHAFSRLKRNRESQEDYAEHAREVARILAELAGSEAATLTETAASTERYRLMIPADWGDEESDGETPAADDGANSPVLGPSQTARELNALGGYRVYTTAYDVELTGASLYPESIRRVLRQALDDQIAAQAVSVRHLAQRLRALFARPVRDDWLFGREDGVLDARRLSQVVTNPTNRRLFKSDRHEPKSDVVVSFLVDSSGSMKAQRYEAVAVLVDTYCRALSLAGAKSEVLGYTTAAWSGGRSIADWRADGSPEEPGRVNETCHIVYKDADTSWKRARMSLASMMNPQHFREGVDGEAVAWAYGRLIERPEPLRILVVISDGSPMDSATANVNGDFYLADHLRDVAEAIEVEQGFGGGVALGALGIDLDVSEFFRRSLNVDLNGTLSVATYAALERLFG